MQAPENIVDIQLEAYNRGDYAAFAACYHTDIVSYDLMTSQPNPHMSGSHFFAHYATKFLENPKIHCLVTQRIVHNNLIIDQEIISRYGLQEYGEVVIYQVDQGLISKMWFLPS